MKNIIASNSPIYYRVNFSDLCKKVVSNLNLTNDDINQCNITVSAFNQLLQGQYAEKNLLNLAIEHLNLNNVKKLLTVIHPASCRVNCYDSLFYQATINDESKQVAKQITELLIEKDTPIEYSDILLEAIRDGAKEEAVSLLINYKKCNKPVTK